MGTDRKEMRKLLNKYIALMKVAFDNGLDMCIWTRLKDNASPWFTGRVHVEDTDFKNDGITSLEFSAYYWRAVEGNEEDLKKVKEFINNHKK